MLVKELVLANPVVCLIDDHLQKTAQLMAENDLNCLPVVETLAHKNLIGIVTESDICREAIAAGFNPSKTTVGRVMNSSFFTVDGETDIEVCYRIMKENKVNHLFITDENNSCQGVITEDDLPLTDVEYSNQNYTFQYIRSDRIF